MVRNAKKIAGYMALGVVGAFLLTYGARSVLYWQAKAKVEEDLTISAELMLERASDATQTAIDVLNRLAQSSGLSCTQDHRYLYSEAVRSTAWIDTIGLVDRNGNLVCTDLGQSSRQRGLLSTYEAGSDEISLSLSSGKSEDDLLSLLVVRHITNGRRLVARVPGELIKLDPVRNELRRFRVAMLSLGPNDPWYILEAMEGGESAVRVNKTSRYVPFEVNISVSEAAIDVVTHQARKIINAFGLIFAMFALLGGYLLGRYRKNEGDRILEALENGEFVPFMQPIVCLETGRITGCEVLSRWNKADGTVVPPHEFIPLAQNYKLTREVTSRIMSDARDVIAPLIKGDDDLKLSFNLFSGQLTDATIVDDIQAVFKDSAIDYGNLIFEVSDRVPITDISLAKDIISQIQALGAEIALDDVGSGHSGLYNLTSIGVDILKLDKLMVDTINQGLAGMELVRGLIKLAGQLNIGVIAEGIETETQVVELRRMGVSAAQGYLFSPPLPARSFAELYKASRALAAKAGSASGDEGDMADREDAA
ncbi:EAL domain-containing protein [uncultured Cohaesibacter sp.]|uniref:EAL domain-containing protein n=1 Tax=uncultured Cohaesibacter sp. TaxID=1002546 RepID=UPI0029C652CC|nr:EAL domain-containing protein [uncultured Cohaesibacter sp.]